MPRNLERRVGSRDTKLGAALQLDVLIDDALPQELGAGGARELIESPGGGVDARGVEIALDAAPAQAATAGEADAPCGEHARERMQQQRVDAERVGHGARVLASGAAEGHQRESPGVLAVAQREFADRVGHPRHRHLDERRGQRLDRVPRSAGVRDCLGDHGKARARGRGVERRVARGPEYLRKAIRTDAAEHHVAVRHRGRAAAPVAGGTGVRAGRVGTDLQPSVGVAHDRAAAGCNRVDVEHRGL